MKKIFAKLFDRKHRSRTISYLIVIVSYVLLTVATKNGLMSSRFKSLLVPTTCYIAAALALNLVVGFSGELSLGHAGFMCVGAFCGICVSSLLRDVIAINGLRVLLAMVTGAVMSGLCGILIGIPVLKLKGDYLAIVTLAFCQIIKSLITNIYLGYDKSGFHFSFVEKKFTLDDTGYFLIEGATGTSGNDRIATFLAGIILIVITLIVIYNIVYSKNGRAIMAARDNSIAATSVAVNTSKVKLLAFAVSATIVGAAGALYALNFSTVTASKFDYNLSIVMLVYVVLGGIGNINGTIIATTALVVIPELLRSLADYRLILYAIVLIATMLISNNPLFIRYKNKILSAMKKGKK